MNLSYNGDRRLLRTVRVGTGWNGSSFNETAATTIEIYDCQGRLWQVKEPAHPDGSDSTTTYRHDVGCRLSQVTQVAESLSGVQLTQARLVDSDHRGFLQRDTVTEVTSPFTAVLGSFTQSWTWNEQGEQVSVT